MDNGLVFKISGSAAADQRLYRAVRYGAAADSFQLRQPHAAACLLGVASAGPDALGQIPRQLIGLGLTGTAAYGKLCAILQYTEGDARIHNIRLQQHITDNSQNVGVAALRFCQSEAVFRHIFAAGQCPAGDSQFLSGQVAVLEPQKQAFIAAEFQLIPQVSVLGMPQLLHFSGIHEQPVVKRRSQPLVRLHSVARFPEHIPDDGGAGSVPVPHLPQDGKFHLLFVVVNYSRHFGREAGDISSAVLTIHAQQ